VGNVRMEFLQRVSWLFINGTHGSYLVLHGGYDNNDVACLLPPVRAYFPHNFFSLVNFSRLWWQFSLEIRNQAN
jgi:hypothetical protein